MKTVVINTLMQVITSYFYPNVIEVQTDNDPLIQTRNRVVYARLVKIYKGVDNVIKLQFKNRDQKPVNITGFSIRFNILNDLATNVLITVPGVIVDAVKGIATVTLTEFDLIDLKAELYNYTASLVYPNGSEQVVYTDDNYDVRGEILVADGHYPEFKDSVDANITTLGLPDDYTSAVIADTSYAGQSANHIAQFYFDNFSGTITIQGTLDPMPPVGSGSSALLNWTDLVVLTFADQTVTDYVTWEGLFSGFRFIIHRDSGDVTKVLLRS